MATTNKGFSWIPRILTMLIILFISMFALDAFSPELNLWQQLSDFVMHLIPSFLLVILLIIAWKRELIGGILFTLLGLIMSPFIYSMNYDRNHNVLMSLGIILAICLPIIVAGILFIISSTKKEQVFPTR
ncbi:MAG: hypothetical protein EYC69_09570 [Bacteroidetes bacterium]|nr:MAG: hypothetical protein EYC69_09570 [Bacteroidota bacterium]